MADPASYRPASGTIPTDPGVYTFRDSDDRVLYVGKAKNLRNRLSNYFQDPAHLNPRIRTMVYTADHVQWTVVSSELEALNLEYTWIKKFAPRFNVMYRDDKTYPMLAVSVKERFPRAFLYRGPRKKGVRYFGPYPKAWAIRETLDSLTRVFRCAPAPPGCTAGTSSWAGPACSATSTAVPRRAWGGSPRRSTWNSSTGSAPSSPAVTPTG
jgi:excinuclease ABC subunit C